MLKKFIKGRDLIRLGVTRIATTYLTLARLHELKASLLTMFRFKEWKTSNFESSHEGRKVENVVHTKTRNHLHHKKVNDLVYLMYNLKLKNKQIRKIVALPFDNIESTNEWIIKDGDNVDLEQAQNEGHGGNVDIVGPSLTDSILDAFDFDNIIFYANVDDAHLSYEKMMMSKMI
nr:hypothetical protein [Phaseolus vulgaris]